MTGSYLIVAFLHVACELTFGRKKTHFPRGWYIYVGSGMKGLEKRIVRHLSPIKKKHWHIDYFLEKAWIEAIVVMPSPQREECKKSRLLEAIGGRVVARKFGSTDCNCATHLYFFSTNPLKDPGVLKTVGLS